MAGGRGRFVGEAVGGVAGKAWEVCRGGRVPRASHGPAVTPRNLPRTAGHPKIACKPPRLPLHEIRFLPDLPSRAIWAPTELCIASRIKLRALEIRSRFSLWYTKMRFHEQLRWGHHGGGTDVAPRRENPLSLTMLVEC
jgi:hypothetical protein